MTSPIRLIKPRRPSSPWMTRQEVADWLRVDPHTVDRWVADGRLTKYQMSDLASYRYSRAEVEAFVLPVRPRARSNAL